MDWSGRKSSMKLLVMQIGIQQTNPHWKAVSTRLWIWQSHSAVIKYWQHKTFYCCLFFFLIRPASRRWHASVQLNITKHVRHVAHQLQIKTITHPWNPTDTSPGSDISFVKQIVCHRCTQKKKTCCTCLWHHQSAVKVVGHYAHVCFCVLIGEKSLLMLCM